MELVAPAQKIRDIILIQTALVQASGETKTKTVRVMLDCGSNQSFIRAQVARDLGCRTLGSEPLKVETFVMFINFWSICPGMPQVAVYL